jgi:crotonobetainyl-CoA:carnitine CoA-transferase CaiB-like acyl-CoA transferase
MALNVPGPLAVARMKQAGATVTKIEPPTGDPLFILSPAWHAEMHRGISIERVDLKTDTGRARVVAHLRDADLFLTSQRPSLLTRHSLDRERLHSQFPALRVLRILGSVREPELPGHDLTYQAQVGLVSDQMPRTLAADVMGSERVFAGVLALLRQPSGSTLDVGLVESLDALLAPLRHGLTTPNGPLGGGAPQYGVYDAKAGRIAVAALEPHFESRLYQELGLATRAELTARLRERTADEWEVWARERDLPIVAVRDVDRSGEPSSR